MKNFYCTNVCGRNDFSIDKWNQLFLKSIKLNLSSKETYNLLGDNNPHCEVQCFECMAIVGKSQIKNKDFRKKLK